MPSLVGTAGPAGYTLGDLVTTTLAILAALIPAIAWIARLFGFQPTIQHGLTNPVIVFVASGLSLMFTSISVSVGYIYPA
jgi:hypothetical protein